MTVLVGRNPVCRRVREQDRFKSKIETPKKGKGSFKRIKRVNLADL